MNLWLLSYRISTAVFIVVLIIVVGKYFVPKIRQGQALQKIEAAKTETNQGYEENIRVIQDKVTRFNSDPKYVERVAREELGKAKEGETIFRYSERKTNVMTIAPPPPPPTPVPTLSPPARPTPKPKPTPRHRSNHR